MAEDEEWQSLSQFNTQKKNNVTSGLNLLI